MRVTGEAQWHGLFGSLLGELHRRGGDLEAAQSAVARALDELEVCTDDVMRIARVSAVGLAVEADRALRARDLREPETEADALARAHIHLDRLEAAAEDGGPVERAWLAVGAAESARAQGAGAASLWSAAAVQWERARAPAIAQRSAAGARPRRWSRQTTGRRRRASPPRPPAWPTIWARAGWPTSSRV